MIKYFFEDIVSKNDGFLRGPFGGALKKDIFVDKSSNTYKVYEQGVILNKDSRLGNYYITKEYFDKSMYRFVANPKDILVSCSGVNYGAIYQLPENSEVGVINQALLRIRLNTDIVDDKYFIYLFENLISKRIIGGSGDSTIPNFPPMNFIRKVPVELPDLITQQKIASVLSALDDKIELNDRINTELEAMAKTLYDYWFVQFDFPVSGTLASTPLSQQSVAERERNNVVERKGVMVAERSRGYKSSGGKMVYNETLKREIPEGWEVKKLEELGNFKNGVNYNPSNPGNIPCPIINVRNISGSSYFIKNEDLDIIYLNENDVKKYSVNENSIIVARSGIPGATRLISDFSENTLYCGFAIHYEIYNPLFKNKVFFYLKSLEELIKNGSGGTIMKNVNQQLLNNLIISIPEKSILSAFNRKIDIIFKKINNLEKQNQELSALRDWLLPMLMNGQVKVE